ncbi:flagellar hook-associated protein FlgK [Clostridium sp. HMP27]|uniref:flagellar hook-associated protein FlgK n=1 Tax=Clostridium sp. HMP27 TaxID=1487921 RepID=UPI00052E2B76|nr:flagellar hook-associated protein FlgK [Clostridium sp. HMP27]KGK86051.1 flagellar hook protein FlgK [Clostridium sp. HMP27]
MSGLFGTLNIGKSGLFSNQKVINTISHNIANANTEGYSRQRAELQTTRPYSNPSLNSSSEAGQVGTGVEVSQITRIRDTFLDFQVREELGIDGWYSGRDKFLTEIEGVFNEPSETGLSSLISKFFGSWQELSKQSETSNARTVVVEQSQALTNELNHTYNKLQGIKENAQDLIKQTVFEANKILDQITQLNQEIIQVSVAKNNPNDLMDRRDVLLDQLSEKFGITVDKKIFNGVDVSTRKDEDANTPKDINLVQAVETKKNADGSIDKATVGRLSYISSIEPVEGETGKYKIEYYKDGDMTDDKNRVVVENVSLTKEEFMKLDQCRVVWTNKEGQLLGADGKPSTTDMVKFTPSSGELKGYMSVQEDVDKYIDQLNKLAKSIAYSVNAVHSQSEVAEDGEIFFFVNKEDATAAGEAGITAGNISINQAIIDNVMLIKTGKDNGGESDGTRALAIAQLQDKLMEVQKITDNMTRGEFIENLCGGDNFPSTTDNTIGTINGKTSGMKVNNYFKDVVDALGVQTQQAKRMVKNQFVLLQSFEESRASVSGVSLDEEMANLVQSQHSYQANSKIISTVDELLDVVINGLKR